MSLRPRVILCVVLCTLALSQITTVVEARIRGQDLYLFLGAHLNTNGASVYEKCGRQGTIGK